MTPRRLCSAVLLLSAATGCAAQPLPAIVYPRVIYPASHYPVSAEASGVKIAAVPFAPGRDVYADPAAPSVARADLPLNVLDAAVLPIRLIVWNDSSEEIVFDPNQIAGLAGAASYYPYPPQDAVEIVTHSDAFRSAVKGSQVGPVVQSLLGGEILLEAVRGGVSGVASGGITGGASGVAKGATGVGLERARGYEKALIQLITKEYTDHAIARQTLYPGFTADGLIFLPSRVGITRLDIRLYAPGSTRTISIGMDLE